jgi:3-deoxy-D-manno-octulosonic-acid transferase
MRFFYTIGIYFYTFFIKIASISNPKAKKWIDGRTGLFDSLQDFRSSVPGHKIIWFHCASLGEFEQGRALIEKIRDKQNDYKIVLSFFSPSGYEHRKNYEKVDFVCYLPSDTPYNAKKFINILKPEKVFFIKYEYWFNYINILWENKIPLYVVSAIFRPNQIFFKKIGFWFGSQLKKVSCFFAQNSDTVELLKSIGIQSVILSGDTRFDRVIDIVNNPLFFSALEQLDKNKTLIVGSSWEADENLISKALSDMPELTLIVAPHEVTQNRINEIKNIFHSKKPILLSQINEANIKAYELIIVDSIGKLSSIYQYGFLAYIGGGFGKGIHNILEAACWGMPIIIGPNYKKFYEAITLLKLGAAFSIKNSDDFVDIVKMLLTNEQQLLSCSMLSKDFVNNQKGVVDKIYSQVFENKQT